MKYVVASTAVTDEIHLPDGRSVNNVGGGAGWYAYSGMRLWSKDVLLVSGIGRDFESMHGNWFVHNNADTKGLNIKGEHTLITLVNYSSDGERVETPVYGLDHYRSYEPQIVDIKPFLSDCLGLYVFRNVDNEIFWEDLHALKKEIGFSLMWEIAADAAIPEKKELVLNILKYVDVFSINRREVSELFQIDEEDSIEFLKTLDVPLIYYRLGKAGAVLISDGSDISVPSIDISEKKDSTGAGNSSSGAVLVGYCNGRGLEEIGTMGSLSAAHTIMQFGPVPDVEAAIQINDEYLTQTNIPNGKVNKKC